MEPANLWTAYRAGDELAREQLLARHLPLVHHVARKILVALPGQAELGDLVSAGTLGLINAIDSFDETRGLAFSTYAAARIRGAILDDLRRWDPAPRSVRRKVRQISRARDSLAGELEREPDSRETAVALGIDVDTLFRWQTSAAEAVQIPLDAPIDAARQRSATPAELLVGVAGDQIEDGITRREEVDALTDALQQMGERDRLVLTLYYFEELKLAEIAQVLDLTESRISQIRKQALRTLRGELASLRGVEA
jgi:RNA polymerase sigma factor for flagellar operon FliA